MRNYIEFYFDEERNFIAEIHKHGKHRRIKNPSNVEKLIEICEKYGYKIEGEGYLDERVITISREYDEYMEKKKKVISKLNVVGNILSNMKLSKKDKALGKRVIAFALAGVITTATIGFSTANNKKHDDPATSEQVQTIDDENQYVSEDDFDIQEIIQPEQIIEETPKVIAEAPPIEDELQEMLQQEQFHFSYEDRTSRENISNARRYEDLFEKYANRYGLDKNLLMAMAAQESCGDHYGNLGNGSAEGIMQIEKAVHVGNTVSAYNFETGEVDKITVTLDKLQDLETNIQIGAMILRSCIENDNYNIPVSLQTYNFGYGNMGKVLAMCCELEGMDKEEIMNCPTNNSWLQYRAFLGVGDPKYVEHVFSYLENNIELTVQRRNGEKITISIANDYQIENQNSLT